MTPDEIGLMRAVMSIALLLTTFSSFGTGAAIIRYFPLKGSTQEALNQLFTFGLVVVLCAFSLLAFGLYAFSNEFFRFFEDKSPEVGEYLLLIAVLVLQMTIFNLLEITARSQKEIVIPNMIRDLVYKMLHAGIIVLFGFGILEIGQYLYGIAVIYALLILAIGGFIAIKYRLALDFRLLKNREELRSLLTFSTIGILGGLGYILMVQIDQVMISKYIGLSENGIYTTATFMAVAVEIPQRFITQISSTIVSDQLALNDRAGLEDIYKKASINQLILGSFIYALILINLDNIYGIMPNGQAFADGWWIFMLIGLVKLVDMAFSLNGEIIGYSKYYTFNLITLIVLAIGAVSFNLYLIPLYGILGAAIATLAAYLLFNLVKFSFVRWKFGISPFSMKSLTSIVMVAALLVVNFIFEYLNNPYLDMIIRSSLFISLFVLITYVLGLSDLFNSLCRKIFDHVISIFSR